MSVFVKCAYWDNILWEQGLVDKWPHANLKNNGVQESIVMPAWDQGQAAARPRP